MSPSSNAQSLSRPPVVAVLGHVDHGKTTLLDHLRKANVAAGEAGGITQSIGAYEIVHNGRKITFIDTPGHEAFTKMRSRGAHVADLAILVVAADEGVKPQTQESIAILRRTETPFIVAITKMEKPGADIERVKNELTAAEVLLEGYGGEVSYQPVSAKTGENMDELLDLILLATDLENLTYNPADPATGFILEAKMDRRRGLEATVIVKGGTLRQGSPIATASARGKVKIMENFRGATAKELMPSAPALIIGFESLPEVGEEFSTDPVAFTAPAAKNGAATTNSVPLTGKEMHTLLSLMIKASDAGSLEALTGIINAMSADKPIRVVGASGGDVVDNDVKFAISAGATILAFRSKTDKAAKALAEANAVKIISSDIIYDLVKAVEELIKEQVASVGGGDLEVLAVFNQAKLEKQVVGGRVSRGIVKNRTAFEVVRGGEVVAQGRITNLQQSKKEVHEVREGTECGLQLGSSIQIAVGDVLITK